MRGLGRVRHLAAVARPRPGIGDRRHFGGKVGRPGTGLEAGGQSFALRAQEVEPGHLMMRPAGHLHEEAVRGGQEGPARARTVRSKASRAGTAIDHAGYVVEHERDDRVLRRHLDVPAGAVSIALGERVQDTEDGDDPRQGLDGISRDTEWVLFLGVGDPRWRAVAESARLDGDEVRALVVSMRAAFAEWRNGGGYDSGVLSPQVRESRRSGVDAGRWPGSYDDVCLAGQAAKQRAQFFTRNRPDVLGAIQLRHRPRRRALDNELDDVSPECGKIAGRV